MKKYQCKKYKIEEIEVSGRIERIFKNRPRNITETLSITAKRFPEQDALISETRRYSFSELDDLTSRIAASLQSSFGVEKGSRVSLLMGVDLDYPLAFFGLMKLGAIAVPLNTRFKAEELAYEIDNSESTLLIADEEFWPVVEQVRATSTRLKDIIVVSKSAPNGTKLFSSLFDSSPIFRKPSFMEETDTAVIMYTSGTTGFPKGAMQTHRGIIASDMLIDDFLGINQKRDRIICAVPLFHSIGTVMTMMGAVFTGIPCVYMRNYKTEDLMRVIEKEKITIMIHVPTVIWLIVNHPKFNEYDLSSLRVAFIGGAAKSTEVIVRIRERLPGVKICEAFGMTETHTMDCLLGDDEIERKINTVGIGIPIEEIKIVDENGQECEAGNPGEVFFRGPKVIPGYWNNLDATRRAIVDGWLHTGDVGKMDEEGYVYILDRIKDMIIRGGENIYSAEVENVLYRHPAVLEAAVVGVADKVMGEEVKAFIVLREGSVTSEDEVRKFCAKTLADYKVPRYIEFRTTLPRNPAGKIIKRALRECEGK
jgi:long-chain acyl-CoA synthetase